MTKEEQVIRSILGVCRSNTRMLVYAVQEAERLLFFEKIPLDDIRITKDIYPAVAERTGKRHQAVARQIERLGNLCWDSMDEVQKKTYIGKSLKDIQAPRDMVFYLAFYCHFGKSYYEVIQEEMALFIRKNREMSEKQCVSKAT